MTQTRRTEVLETSSPAARAASTSSTWSEFLSRPAISVVLTVRRAGPSPSVPCHRKVAWHLPYSPVSGSKTNPRRSKSEPASSTAPGLEIELEQYRRRAEEAANERLKMPSSQIHSPRFPGDAPLRHVAIHKIRKDVSRHSSRDPDTYVAGA